jgi:hypothetical protein
VEVVVAEEMEPAEDLVEGERTIPQEAQALLVHLDKATMVPQATVLVRIPVVAEVVQVLPVVLVMHQVLVALVGKALTGIP